MRPSTGRALSTPAQLSHQFTESTYDVWCPRVEDVAAVNISPDGTAGFCQLCGATDHKRL